MYQEILNNAAITLAAVFATVVLIGTVGGVALTVQAVFRFLRRAA